MARRRKNYKRKPMGSLLFLLGLVLVVITAVTVIVRNTVFVVKDIQVVGNARIPTDQIIALSGIEMGESLSKVNAAKIKQGFERSGMANFESFEVQRPSTVRLFVRERIVRAVFNYAGMPTLVDEYGYAMEQSRELQEGYTIPTVTGLKLTQCEVGRIVVSEVPYQVDSMNEVIAALYVQKLAQYVSELNVSDLDNLYLMTRSGMMVKIGDMQNVNNKLLWMQSALSQLTAEGNVTGVLDVSSGQSAIYQPHAAPQTEVEVQ